MAYLILFVIQCMIIFYSCVEYYFPDIILYFQIKECCEKAELHGKAASAAAKKAPAPAAPAAAAAKSTAKPVTRPGTSKTAAAKKVWHRHFFKITSHV